MTLFLPAKLDLEPREETEFIRHLGDDRWLYEAAWERKRNGKVVALATEKDRGSVLPSPFGHGCVPKVEKEIEIVEAEKRGQVRRKGRVSMNLW